MKILSLDLGSDTGFAVLSPGRSKSGTWALATGTELKEAKRRRMDRRCDVRVTGLWRHLHEIFQWAGGLDWIVFEDVQFGNALGQVQLWSSFRGAVWTFASEYNIAIDCLTTWELKKFATGSPHANKAAMAKHWCLHHPRLFSLEKGLAKRTDTGIFLSDDEVDALHLLDWATKRITP